MVFTPRMLIYLKLLTVNSAVLLRTFNLLPVLNARCLLCTHRFWICSFQTSLRMTRFLPELFSCNSSFEPNINENIYIKAHLLLLENFLWEHIYLRLRTTMFILRNYINSWRYVWKSLVHSFFLCSSTNIFVWPVIELQFRNPQFIYLAVMIPRSTLARSGETWLGPNSSSNNFLKPLRLFILRLAF